MGNNRYKKAEVKITLFGAGDALAVSDPNELPVVPVNDWTDN